ncbi:LamB/YcsF family protein [Lactiplantibacillus pentosus]|uniref:5-oxoprolinase subunit A n=3 Tax=Lactiplantibacillus pentosus TaxID=1589 RepID=A0AAX6LER8_LACPE|nr:5-oxoprolinase subunit PxpA [Lactiplantibacillus pentosus]AYJ42393.1 5-oxoprolinase subunit PxpA [Lactiplantibacillus pentosus]KRK24461.1 hypothetical protein FD24_GL000386 [Lactiplantibacillus pentosus DSM 20314]MBU7496554.1 5-oxoprolinase subunit PxpA [Lactiplantibacillus pentosus]MCC3162129.1 5-oxoprolinase subunit PxpA [Lactiplantibacillus pentosus]MCJ8187290.1 5-oxoprolinase subunit PxpA [Lactiplantibacillus pentosus]
MKIDLNCDLGESFGRYSLGMDEQVLAVITSANIACGFHAGDPEVMQKTVALAHKNQVAIGAHPGFPDLVGFGRRKMQLTPAAVEADIVYQLGALQAFCGGTPLHHVKPHGALYNMAADDLTLATAICNGIASVDPSTCLIGLANSNLIKAARQVGLPYAQEVFADRQYLPNGRLVPRNQPNAMIADEDIAVQRVLRMVKDHVVTAVDGSEVSIIPDTICVHGDGPKALAFVKRIHAALIENQIAVTAF